MFFGARGHDGVGDIAAWVVHVHRRYVGAVALHHCARGSSGVRQRIEGALGLCAQRMDAGRRSVR